MRGIASTPSEFHSSKFIMKTSEIWSLPRMTKFMKRTKLSPRAFSTSEKTRLRVSWWQASQKSRCLQQKSFSTCWSKETWGAQWRQRGPTKRHHAHMLSSKSPASTLKRVLVSMLKLTWENCLWSIWQGLNELHAPATAASGWSRAPTSTGPSWRSATVSMLFMRMWQSRKTITFHLETRSWLGYWKTALAATAELSWSPTSAPLMSTLKIRTTLSSMLIGQRTSRRMCNVILIVSSTTCPSTRTSSPVSKTRLQT